MFLFKCVFLMPLLKILLFKCCFSNASFQMLLFKCSFSNASFQIFLFKCFFSNTSFQMFLSKCFFSMKIIKAWSHRKNSFGSHAWLRRWCLATEKHHSETWRFAICHNRFATCDLRFATCDLRSAICYRFATCDLRTPHSIFEPGQTTCFSRFAPRPDVSKHGKLVGALEAVLHRYVSASDMR